MGLCCGIDFGTTYSAISCGGQRVMRSVVYFPGPDQDPIVGQAAWHARAQFPDRVIQGIKRSIGVADAKIGPIDGVEYTPEDIAAIIIKSLVKDASDSLGEEITDAVIAVPACFDTNQLAATRKAGELAGLNVLTLLPEPHAALLTYCADRASDLNDKYVLVYDLGGGTFDVVLMRVPMSGSSEGGDLAGVNIETVAMEGNSTLGGLDWDRALAEIVGKKVMAEHEVDVRSDPLDEALLLDRCEEAKLLLGSTNPVIVTADRAGHSAEVTRTEFEDCTANLLRETQALLENVLKKAESQHNINPDDITVMLAGGATHMPMVAKMVECVTRRPPLQHLNPDLLVSMGAAHWAHLQDRGTAAEAARGDFASVELAPPPIDTAMAVAAEAPLAPTSPIYDENVQFTVYRPKAIQPEKWYDLPAFAHLSERRPDAPPDEPDPVQQVQEMAKRVLGEQVKEYEHLKQDSRQAIPQEGELTFVPEMEGVEFNPGYRTFRWTDQSVHKEEFQLRASAELDGTTARGRLTVYLGSRLIADVPLAIRVDSSAEVESKSLPRETACAHPYRKIFASYSHKDVAIVEQVESLAEAIGDRYIRDCRDLRGGEVWTERLAGLIEEADIFQLFWSTNSMDSPFVRQEWEHALGLSRENFIRPTYWEEPMPQRPEEGLPPEALRRLHFQQIGGQWGAHLAPVSRTSPTVALEEQTTTEPVGDAEGVIDLIPEMVELAGPQKAEPAAVEQGAEEETVPASLDKSGQELPLDDANVVVGKPKRKKMYYNEQEAAETLGISAEEFAKYIRNDKVRVFQDGPRKMFLANDIDTLAGKADSAEEEDIQLDPAEAAGGEEVELVACEPPTDQVDLIARSTEPPTEHIDATAQGKLPAAEAGPQKAEPAAVEQGAEEETVLAAYEEMAFEKIVSLDKAGQELTLDDACVVEGITKRKEDTVITAEGISIFDEEDLEIEAADPGAKTQIAPSLEDQISIEGVGSGSGLRDLTRESDDTALGAEVLDHIDEMTTDGAAQLEPVSVPEIEAADPMAKKQPAPSLEDQIADEPVEGSQDMVEEATEPVGDGEGLQDLTREGDDASPEAEVLDHIDETTDGAAKLEPVAMQEVEPYQPVAACVGPLFSGDVYKKRGWPAWVVLLIVLGVLGLFVGFVLWLTYG